MANNNIVSADQMEDRKEKKSNGDEEGHVLAVNIKEGDEVDVKEEDNSTSNHLDSKEDEDLHSIKQEDQLKSTKAKMDEVREENERLKQLISKIAKDYMSLKIHFCGILQKEAEPKNPNKTSHHEAKEEASHHHHHELVSLSLGRRSSTTTTSTTNDQEPKTEDTKIINSSSDEGKEVGLPGKLDDNYGGLNLGLDCKFKPADLSVTVKNPSSETRLGEAIRKEGGNETWPPSKVLKAKRSAEDEEVLQQTHVVKKTRVSVRARCETSTMNDGCQWRKYGQKIAKGNPCPRAYYRCTLSPTCPVRKQVQRCVEDMSILITTYEGTHNHPLPLSATAMASTTSSAASMLLSPSSTSNSGGTSSAPISISTGLSFSLSQNHHFQYGLQNSPNISTSNSHPTITLDLTAPTTTASQYPNNFSLRPTSVFPSKSINFSSPLELNHSLITSWGKFTSNYPTNYGTVPYGRNHIGSLKDVGRQPQSYLQITNQNVSPQQNLTETIAAATKVIASNPNFRSALAAAISSYAGSIGGGEVRENFGSSLNGLNLKLGE